MIINMNGAKAPETPSSVLQEKTITPETLPTVIGPDEGYDGLSQVTVNPDSQLKAENIRSGKTIFGVTGAFVGETISSTSPSIDDYTPINKTMGVCLSLVGPLVKEGPAIIELTETSNPPSIGTISVDVFQGVSSFGSDHRYIFSNVDYQNNSYTPSTYIPSGVHYYPVEINIPAGPRECSNIMLTRNNARFTGDCKIRDCILYLTQHISNSSATGVPFSYNTPYNVSKVYQIEDQTIHFERGVGTINIPAIQETPYVFTYGDYAQAYGSVTANVIGSMEFVIG